LVSGASVNLAALNISTPLPRAMRLLFLLIVRDNTRERAGISRIWVPPSARYLGGVRARRQLRLNLPRRSELGRTQWRVLRESACPFSERLIPPVHELEDEAVHTRRL
jgi:hypothetical protein